VVSRPAGGAWTADGAWRRVVRTGRPRSGIAHLRLHYLDPKGRLGQHRHRRAAAQGLPGTPDRIRHRCQWRRTGRTALGRGARTGRFRVCHGGHRRRGRRHGAREAAPRARSSGDGTHGTPPHPGRRVHGQLPVPRTLLGRALRRTRNREARGHARRRPPARGPGLGHHHAVHGPRPRQPDLRAIPQAHPHRRQRPESRTVGAKNGSLPASAPRSGPSSPTTSGPPPWTKTESNASSSRPCWATTPGSAAPSPSPRKPPQRPRTTGRASPSTRLRRAARTKPRISVADTDIPPLRAPAPSETSPYP
jgi:hypothetical protein